MTKWFTPALALVATLALPGRAAAWHLGAELLTDAPVDVGGRLWTEVPGRLRLHGSYGYVPSSNVDALNSLLVATGAYDSSVARVIKSGVASAQVWRVGIGWRPFASHGFYLQGEYGQLMLGGTVAERDLLAAAKQPDMPGNTRAYTLDSTLHQVGGELGWGWLVGSYLSLRAGVGFTGTLASTSSITPNYTTSDPQQMQMYVNQAQKILDTLYTRYVFAPTLNLAAGWQFF